MTRQTFIVMLLLILTSPLIAAHGSQPEVRQLRLPDGGIQPQAMIDDEGVVHVVYFSGKPQAGDIYYTRILPDTDSFTAPVRVNSEPGSAVAVGTIRGAHMAIGRNGRIHVSWNGSRTATPRAPNDQSPLLYTRSVDGDTAFEPQRNIIQRQTMLDGGSSIAADGDGRVYLVWHALAEGDPAGEQNRQIWMARSTDDGESFSSEVAAAPVQRGACGCCGLKAFTGPKGDVFILYRSAWDIVNRNMYLLASDDHGAEFRELSSHPWRIGQCVMSSASFNTAGDDVLAAWESQEQVYFTRIDADTNQVPEPIAAPGRGNNRKHPTIAADASGRTLLVWTEGTAWEKGGDVVWQIYGPDGSPMPSENGRAKDLPVWGTAAAVAGPNGVFTVIY